MPIKSKVRAKRYWQAIPPAEQEKVLNNVYCSECKRGVSVTKYSYIMDGKLFILTGRCTVCGGKVVRIDEAD